MILALVSRNHSECKVQNAIWYTYPLSPPLCVLYFYHTLLLGIWVLSVTYRVWVLPNSMGYLLNRLIVWGGEFIFLFSKFD